MTKSALLIGTTIILVLLALGISAHAELESCKPPIDGSVTSSPDKIVCTTSESMDALQSSLQVFDHAGVRVDRGDSQVDLNDRDYRTIFVSLDPLRMNEGEYTVKWKTFSADDGDEAGGEFKLRIRK